MPRFKGVYRDANGWYFKARTFKDPLTGKWTQVTRRGFATATEAAKARQRMLDQASTGLQAASKTGNVLSHCRHTTWNEVKASFARRATCSRAIAGESFVTEHNSARSATELRAWSGDRLTTSQRTEAEPSARRPLEFGFVAVHCDLFDYGPRWFAWHEPRHQSSQPPLTSSPSCSAVMPAWWTVADARSS